MRTKLVLGAVILAAGLASSMAQVYSLNVVGYVNQTVQANHWYLLGNPLDLSAQGGTNTTTYVLSGLKSASGNPDDWANSVVYGFTGGAYSGTADTYYAGFGWAPGTIDLTPGNGFFFQAGTNGTVTFVGQVVTTNTFTLAGPNAWSLVSSAFPATNSLVAMGLAGNNNDLVYRYGDTAHPGGFNNGTTYYASFGWADDEGSPVAGPTLNVGEAVFYQNNTAAVKWVQSFTIQ